MNAGALQKLAIWRKFSQDRWGMLALGIVLVFFLLACLVWWGLAGQGWEEMIHEAGYSGVSARHWFGTNFNGQDIFARTLYSTKTAFEVGFVVAVCAIGLGVLLGVLAGFYHGKPLDHVITWLFACLDSIPFYLLAASIAVTFKEARFGMHLAMVASLWTSTCKVMRAQVMKIKARSFIEATQALGASDLRILFHHVLPNTAPIILIEFSLSFVTAIKTEAVLSFLGLGSKEGVSWGLMLAEASSEIQAGQFHNFFAASLFMFTLVMAFNQLSDALQNALDPKQLC